MQIVPTADVADSSVSLKDSVIPLFPASSKCQTNKHPSFLQYGVNFFGLFMCLFA